MIELIWGVLFSLVLLIIFYGLLKDLNTLIMKKYLLYFCHLSLKEVYEQGEETEARIWREMSENFRKEEKSIQKGVKISDYSSLKDLKERFESQLIELKNKKNGNNSKQIKYVEDWISKLDKEIKKIS
jgi:hypothetical protein